MTQPTQVKIVEVSPRDGLQNEAKVVPTKIKLQLIHRLTEADIDLSALCEVGALSGQQGEAAGEDCRSSITMRMPCLSDSSRRAEIPSTFRSLEPVLHSHAGRL